MFTGFPQETPAFFAAIRYNNNREFFEENRHTYERVVREPLIALAEALAPAVHAIDPQLDTRPGRAVSRIFRDVRFRKDKAPYRDYMWIGYRRHGETREETCGFYFDISDTAANWGCGYYHTQQHYMRNLRERIADKPDEVLAVVGDPAFMASFEVMGESYTRQYRPPEGMPTPLATLYRKKNVYAEHHVQALERLHSPALADEIIAGFETLAPFYALLRACMIKRVEGTKE